MLPAIILAVIRKAPLKLETLEQDGETEPSGAGLVAHQFALVGGERPVSGEFVRVPVLLPSG